MVIPPVANQSQRERDLEMQQNNEINGRESGDSRTEYQSTVLPASAVDFDPEPHRRLFRQFANPAPLGLSGFALTTFVLSLINVQARSILVPNIVIGLGMNALG
jgi:GPR1/FUN34/yaaH family